jgi:hypothetical protein
MPRNFLIAAVLAALPGLVLGQTVTPLRHQPPDGADMTFQLTDGTVLTQGYKNSDWYVLTPDKTGSYINGTWTKVGSLPRGYAPYAEASRVLADGRVLIEGGEYNRSRLVFTNLGAIYDPIKQTWSPVKPPKGWKWIGDSPAAVLPDGRFLLGQKFFKRVAAFDPTTLNWTELASRHKNDWNAEEGWTLMPDGTILTYDVKDNPYSESYNPSTGTWTNLGSTVQNLQGGIGRGCIKVPPKDWCYYPPGEVGPGILRPDGTVFATGARHQGATSAHTAIYTPGSGWAAGPDIPDDAAGDSFAVLLPDGDVLFEGGSGELYDFNGSTLTSTGENASGGSLMVLPTGQILVGGVEVFTPTGTYQTAWQPAISSYHSRVMRGSTYQISGTQFNGMSEANSFGDELDQATNYPLVQLTNNSTRHVFYARTHDHSSMGVQTGSATITTNFDVPTNMETGASAIVVIANGIPSSPVSVTVQ